VAGAGTGWIKSTMLTISDLKYAAEIDLFEACYALGNEDLTIFDDLPPDLLPQRDKAGSSIADMVHHYRRFLRERRESRKRFVTGELLFFAPTPNNVRALRFIQEHYEGNFFTSSVFCGIRELLLTPLFLPRLWQLYRRASAHRKKTVRLYLHEYLGFYPIFLGAVKFLRETQPVAVFFANDHAMSPRAVFYAAKYLGIRTVYIQHASITSRMPPLQFDLALLDGPATLDKYEETGPSESQVVFVGLPRMAPPDSEDRASAGTALGVATTLLDRLDLVEETVSILREQFPDRNIRFRSHPAEHGERKAGWEDLCKRYALEESRAREEPIGIFLRSIAVLTAGDCSIHLEAALAGVPGIMLPWSGSLTDRYGYIKNELVSVCSINDELKRCIEAGATSIEALMRYVAILDSDEGKQKVFSSIDLFLGNC